MTIITKRKLSRAFYIDLVQTLKVLLVLGKLMKDEILYFTDRNSKINSIKKES